MVTLPKTKRKNRNLGYLAAKIGIVISDHKLVSRYFVKNLVQRTYNQPTNSGAILAPEYSHFFVFTNQLCFVFFFVDHSLLFPQHYFCFFLLCLLRKLLIRFPREAWGRKAMKNEGGSVVFTVPGSKPARVKREMKNGEDSQSVFSKALEGLEKLKTAEWTDMEVMAAAISVAESKGGFNTSDRETIINLGEGRTTSVSEDESKGIKLMITFLNS